MSRRIMYLRSSHGQPIGCIAISVERNSATVQYQISVLNPRDNFNRSVARHLAIGRLVENPRSINIKKSANMHDVSSAVMQDIVCNGKNLFPSRAIKSAKLWINSNSED